MFAASVGLRAGSTRVGGGRCHTAGVWDAIRLVLNFVELREIAGVDAIIYAVLALIGTGLFLLRLGLGLIFGIGEELDFDADLGDGGDFGLLSFLSITAFIMGTGWMGLVAQLDWRLSDPVSALLAVGFGGAMMLLSAGLLFGMQKLAHEPTTDLQTAVGRTGTVYMTIPDGGGGKVRVDVSGTTMIREARGTPEAGRLSEFTDVRVSDVRDDGVLIVEPLVEQPESDV